MIATDGYLAREGSGSDDEQMQGKHSRNSAVGGGCGEAFVALVLVVLLVVVLSVTVINMRNNARFHERWAERFRDGDPVTQPRTDESE